MFRENGNECGRALTGYEEDDTQNGREGGYETKKTDAAVHVIPDTWRARYGADRK